jgi:hypothetical protein
MRRQRIFYGGCAAVLVLYAVHAIAVDRATFSSYVAVDYDIYIDAARRWLAGGTFYDPAQLAGPYDITVGVVLYPPSVMPLLVAFTALPAVLWWAIPIGLTTYAVWRLRPAPVAWPFIALCLAMRATEARLLSGNPVIWAVAALAMGTLYAWPSVLVVIKPSLGPFALFGIRHRSWWVALAALAIMSVPFLKLWLDWVKVVLNSNGGLDYSLLEVPMMLIPLIAWVARDRTISSRANVPVAASDPVG